MGPLVYIIILFYNGKRWIKPCIDSVLETEYSNFKILAVDNASEDGSADYIKNEYPQIDLIMNGKNLGFAEGNNVGIRYALGKGADYVVLLNQDTTVDSKWLSSLLDIARIDTEIGILSSMQYTYDGKAIDQNFNELINTRQNENDYFIEIDRVIGCSMMLTKKCLNEVGGFDPIYFCYHEETDLCRRARRKGFKIVAAKKSKIFHWHALLNNEKMNPEIENLFKRNEFICHLKNPNKTFLRNYFGYFKWKMDLFHNDFGIIGGTIKLFNVLIWSLKFIKYFPRIIRNRKNEELTLCYLQYWETTEGSMIKYNIIIFGLHYSSAFVDRSYRTRNGQILKSMLGNKNIEKIIYVEPFYRSDSILKMIKWIFITMFENVFFGNEVFAKISLLRIRKISEKIVSLRLVNIDSILKNNKKRVEYYSEKIKKVLQHFGLQNIVLWLYPPVEARFIGNLGEKVSVFDTVDNWLALEESKEFIDKVQSGYELIKEKSDIIFANGEKMELFFHRKQGNVYTIPNGIDLHFFRNKEVDTCEVPRDLMNVNNPIICYVGNVQSRFDANYIKYIAKEKPEWSIVIIGKLMDPVVLNGVVGLKNVYILGVKPYYQIPRYLKWVDVCIMPHKQNKLTESMSPLKLYEYIAAGKPVITTPVEGINELEEFVEVVDTPSLMLDKINEYLESDLHIIADELFFSNISWSKRTAIMFEKIEKMLREKYDKNLQG